MMSTLDIYYYYVFVFDENLFHYHFKGNIPNIKRLCILFYFQNPSSWPN